MQGAQPPTGWYTGGIPLADQGDSIPGIQPTAPDKVRSGENHTIIAGASRCYGGAGILTSAEPWRGMVYRRYTSWTDNNVKEPAPDRGVRTAYEAERSYTLPQVVTNVKR